MSFLLPFLLFEPSCPCVFSFTFSFLLSFLLFYPYTMSSSSIHQLSTSEDEFLEPLTSSRPFTASGYEHHPRIIAMVRAQTISGLENEDLDHHLQVFEDLCSCLVIPGISQETLRWKLFPFSLVGKAKQWYTHNVRGTIHDWEELRDDFCLSFSSASHTASLRS